jgi:hypothetical protein
MSNLATASVSTPSQLVRIWHVETLSTVARDPNAVRFVRTSYCLVPASWTQLDEVAMRERILYALDLSYRFRNHQSARSGDPAEIWWVAVGFELVDAVTMPPTTHGDEEVDLEYVSVRADRAIHPGVIDAAARQVVECWYVARPGLDAQPWTETFSAFRYDADDTCHLVKFRDRAPMFEAAFGGGVIRSA